MSERSADGLITKIESRGNSGVYAVYVDGELAFEADDEAILAFGLREGVRVGPDIVERALVRASQRRARMHALRLLAIRPRTVSETRRRLEARGFDGACVDATIEWLKSLGYLDDRAFAEDFVSSRASVKPMGKRRIAFELQQKGIDREVLGEVLKEIDPDRERRLAWEAANSRLGKMSDDHPDRLRRRIESFLYRRGFGAETIRQVVSELLPE